MEQAKIIEGLSLIKVSNGDLGKSKIILYNDVFLRKLCHYLDIEDLKSFRCVCTKWKSASEPYFRRRTSITFNFARNVTGSNGDLIVKQNEDFDRWRSLFFKSIFDGDISFKEVCLLNVVRCEDISAFSNLLMENQGFVKEIRVFDFFSYSVKFALQKLDISSLMLQFVTKVNFRNCSVAFNKLPLSVKDVRLDECVVTAFDNCKIRLKAIDLINVQFMEGKAMKNVIINQLIELEHLEVLKLYCDDGLKNILLDVSGSLKLSKVELTNIVILGGEYCEWEIDRLELLRTEFPLLKSFKIKELVIYNKGIVNIPQLPKTLERLLLGDSTIGSPTGSERIFLPNLKYLFINEMVDVNFLTRTYSACQSLQTIELNWHLYGDSALDLNLPNSIKTVKIRFKNNRLMQVSGNKMFLEKLILFPSYHLPNQSIAWKNMEMLMEKFSAKHLVVNFNSLKSETVHELLQLPFESVTVGVLNWSPGNLIDDSFNNNTDMCQLVDKKSRFYIFEKGRGRAISSRSFADICERLV